MNIRQSGDTKDPSAATENTHALSKPVSSEKLHAAESVSLQDMARYAEFYSALRKRGKQRNINVPRSIP